MWELTATEYVLDTRPNAAEFTLKLNKPFANSTKWSDVSNVSILSFNIGYSKYDKAENADREVLLMFLDPGYMTEYGIDLTLVSWLTEETGSRDRNDRRKAERDKNAVRKRSRVFEYLEYFELEN